MEAEEEKLLPPSRLKSYVIQPDDSRILTRKISDTRLITVTYSVAIALIGALLFGYAIGYSSPVINELGDKRELGDNRTKDGYLEKNEYQGIFSVRKIIVICSDYNGVSCC